MSHEKDPEMRIESQEEKDARIPRQNGDKGRQTRLKQKESEGKEATDRIIATNGPVVSLSEPPARDRP
jgi:hypothetical protein